MAHLKQISKRRWRARVRLGKWVPLMVVLWLDDTNITTVVSDKWEEHPTVKGFWRLRRSAEVGL